MSFLNNSDALKEICKIHGIGGNNSFLDNDSESDSGKSVLDEEYYKAQPPPIPVDPRNVARITKNGAVTRVTETKKKKRSNNKNATSVDQNQYSTKIYSRKSTTKDLTVDQIEPNTSKVNNNTKVLNPISNINNKLNHKPSISASTILKPDSYYEAPASRTYAQVPRQVSTYSSPSTFLKVDPHYETPSTRYKRSTDQVHQQGDISTNWNSVNAQSYQFPIQPSTHLNFNNHRPQISSTNVKHDTRSPIASISSNILYLPDSYNRISQSKQEFSVEPLPRSTPLSSNSTRSTVHSAVDQRPISTAFSSTTLKVNPPPRSTSSSNSTPRSTGYSAVDQKPISTAFSSTSLKVNPPPTTTTSKATRSTAYSAADQKPISTAFSSTSLKVNPPPRSTSSSNSTPRPAAYSAVDQRPSSTAFSSTSLKVNPPSRSTSLSSNSTRSTGRYSEVEHRTMPSPSRTVLSSTEASTSTLLNQNDKTNSSYNTFNSHVIANNDRSINLQNSAVVAIPDQSNDSTEILVTNVDQNQSNNPEEVKKCCWLSWLSRIWQYFRSLVGLNFK